MADSQRQLQHADEVVARDRQIEALLEDGLDRYFSGRYEDAIHLWTRVLFLDRTHARARAYIDRARTAVAEAQRRSEELLQASRDLLDRGQTTAARELLSQALAGPGDDVQAAALGARLDRLERARDWADSGPAPHSSPETVPGWSWRRTSPVLAAAVGVIVVVAAAAVVAVMSLPETDRPPAVRSTPAAQLPSLSSSAVALTRARALVARGRLSEALARLEGVASDSPERAAADQLRIEIQQLLLASVRPSSGSASVEANRR